jgi:hypothetical protein
MRVQIVGPQESIAETQPQLQPMKRTAGALGIVDDLRRGFARLKLGAHFL